MPLRKLLRGLIDYAGLFPPAALPMDQAAANYATERGGPDAWALARLIVPAARLNELVATKAIATDSAGGPWSISALLGTDLLAGLEQIAAFNAEQAGRARVDAVELHAATVGPLLAAELRLPPGLIAYVELPAENDPGPVLARLSALGMRAKIRCGGVTPAIFPAPAALARFLGACVRTGLPFKATAGLHHPISGDYRLTYAPDSPCAPMYGFLNLLLATAALRAGADEALAIDLLLERDPAALSWGQDGVAWRDLRFSAPDLVRTRAESLIAIGSCSFREPVEETASLYGAL